ncbi:MAG TPA: hypothetical protein DCE81_12475 [Cytophagales bacterium]|nr:hypothetical protein [Cyclobacteriaceae bacterium]HAC25719.1 hypothetical protein [Cytophagales bacterium]
MAGLAFDVLRVGKKYRLVNYGERYEFEILKILVGDFELKDLHTLERYRMSELIRFGRGSDFEIREVE